MAHFITWVTKFHSHKAWAVSPLSWLCCPTPDGLPWQLLCLPEIKLSLPPAEEGGCLQARRKEKENDLHVQRNYKNVNSKEAYRYWLCFVSWWTQMIQKEPIWIHGLPGIKNQHKQMAVPLPYGYSGMDLCYGPGTEDKTRNIFLLLF